MWGFILRYPPYRLSVKCMERSNIRNKIIVRLATTFIDRFNAWNWLGVSNSINQSAGYHLDSNTIRTLIHLIQSIIERSLKRFSRFGVIDTDSWVFKVVRRTQSDFIAFNIGNIMIALDKYRERTKCHANR